MHSAHAPDPDHFLFYPSKTPQRHANKTTGKNAVMARVRATAVLSITSLFIKHSLTTPTCLVCSLPYKGMYTYIYGHATFCLFFAFPHYSTVFCHAESWLDGKLFDTSSLLFVCLTWPYKRKRVGRETCCGS